MSSTSVTQPSRPLKVFVFHVSPPCRAVTLLLSHLGIEHEVIDTTRDDMLKDDFLKLNPMHTVPTLVDGDFALSESRAIMTYVLDKYCGGDHPLYPRDVHTRATINSRLYYDGCNMFRDVRAWVRPQLPIFGSHPPDPATEEDMKVHLVNVERVLSGPGAGQYLVPGVEHMTVADISMLATLTFLDVAHYDLSSYPRVVQYVERVRGELQPHYDRINQHQLALIQRMKEGGKSAEGNK